MQAAVKAFGELVAAREATSELISDAASAYGTLGDELGQPEVHECTGEDALGESNCGPIESNDANRSTCHGWPDARIHSDRQSPAIPLRKSRGLGQRTMAKYFFLSVTFMLGENFHSEWHHHHPTVAMNNLKSSRNSCSGSSSHCGP